jgi:hypothetical protein
MKLLIKPPALHPTLQREPIKLKRIDWAEYEDFGYRGIEKSVLAQT